MSAKNSVRRIIITQEISEPGRKLFQRLEKKYDVEFIYHSFLHIRSLSVEEFKKSGLNISEFTGIIFSNKVSMELFFELLKKLGVELPLTVRYFCPTERLALYLQKFVSIRKRKWHYPKKGKGKEELLKYLNKYKEEKFLFVGRPQGRHYILTHLRKHKRDFKILPIYKFEAEAFEDVEKLRSAELICFSAPAAIDAYCELYPDMCKEKPVGIYGSEAKKLAKRKKMQVAFEGPTAEDRTLYDLISKYLLTEKIKN